jgi:hypothetical protein
MACSIEPLPVRLGYTPCLSVSDQEFRVRLFFVASHMGDLLVFAMLDCLCVCL